jgi:uncharacterized protein (DUF58 family)
MIVPKSRLLFWVGLIFLPFSVLLTAAPSTAMLSAGLMAAFVILAAIDGFLAFGGLDGVSVDLPEVMRLSKGREGELALRIHNDRIKNGRLRLGLAFPPGVYSPNRDMTAELSEKWQYSSVKWPLKALDSGRHILDKCYMEVSSPLGFWAMRKTAPTASEIRVYPALFHEQKYLAALFMNRGLGIHKQRQVGRGRDFEHLREYFPGDSYEDIHWKATARRGHPITKVYQIERTQKIYVIIDASRLSCRRAGSENGASFPATILERFVTASLIMDLAAERQGDLFGMLTFDDRVRKFLTAKSGKTHYNACRDALYTLRPHPVTPDFSELFTFICTRIRRRALLLFLTNLDDPVMAESFVRNIKLISRRHLVLVNVLKPVGVKPLFSSSSVASVDDLYAHLGGHFLWQSLNETGKVLESSGIGFSLLDNEKMCAQLVSQYLNVKQRQIL